MPDTNSRLPIGDIAQRAGMSTSRVRYYERRGLIDPPDRAGGKRQYHPRVLRRLALHKLPEIDELIQRATTVQQLLKFCGDSEPFRRYM